MYSYSRGGNLDNTKIYNSEEVMFAIIDDMLKDVIIILSERGYNPINQIVGYLMSGDPGYISSYKEARTKITKYNRAQILEVLLSKYIKK